MSCNCCEDVDKQTENPLVELLLQEENNHIVEYLLTDENWDIVRYLLEDAEKINTFSNY